MKFIASLFCVSESAAGAAALTFALAAAFITVTSVIFALRRDDGS